MKMTPLDIQAELDLLASLDGTTRRGGGRTKSDDDYLESFRDKGRENLDIIEAYKANTSTEIKSRYWFFYSDGKWFVDCRVGTHSIATKSIGCGVNIDVARIFINAMIKLSETDETVQASIIRMAKYAKTPKGAAKPKATHNTRQLLQPIWAEIVAAVAAINTAQATPVAEPEGGLGEGTEA